MEEIDFSKFGFRKGYNPDKRFHLVTIVKYQDKEYRVSTVDLGLDHSFGFGPPLYYETMIFKHNQKYEEENPFEWFQERYTTKKEAIAKHKEIVKAFKNENFLEELRYYQNN